MADKMSEFRPNLRIFGVTPHDGGWIYVLKHADLFKIGKTKSPERRLRAAKTWLPDLQIVAIKPFWNISAVEDALHTGFCRSWYEGEWFRFTSKAEEEWFIEGIQGFYDEDRDMNSLDFIYFMNGNGLAEFTLERSRRNVRKRKWMRQESDTRKRK